MWQRWLWARQRLLASPRFQRWAVANPLTRRIARQQARQLFDLCAGFVYSQVLLACVRLNLLPLLAAAPQSPAVLATRIDLPPAAMERLLAAAASLRLTRRHRDGRYGVGDLGAALLGTPGLADMVRHHAMLYRDLGDPVALLRGAPASRELARYWSYAGAAQPAALPAHQVADYSALMAASQPLVANEVLAAYRFQPHRCLLDVGGGEGAFLSAVGTRHRHLALQLFDLPSVVARASAHLAAAGLSDRVQVFAGDFHADPLPRGADLVALVRVIHDHDDAAALSLLRAVHRALPTGGTLLLAEPMAGTPGAEPMGAAYFGFYLLAMGAGQPRTPLALKRLLGAAGFGGVRLLPTRMPLQTQVLVATAVSPGSVNLT